MSCQVCYDTGEVWATGVRVDGAVWDAAVIVPCPACSGQAPEQKPRAVSWAEAVAIVTEDFHAIEARRTALAEREAAEYEDFGALPEAPSATPGLVEGCGPGRASANTGPPPKFPCSHERCVLPAGHANWHEYSVTR